MIDKASIALGEIVAKLEELRLAELDERRQAQERGILTPPTATIEKPEERNDRQPAAAQRGTPNRR